MEPNSRRKSFDARARLAQFTAAGSSKGDSAVESANQQNLQNWPQSMLLCGSNAFNQLSAGYGELMSANLLYVHHPMFIGPEIMQVSCNSNQTMVLTAEELPPDPQKASKVEAGEDISSQKRYNFQIYMWGAGKSLNQMKVPVPLPPKCSIAQISCGFTHMGFITERGQAFTWGAGDHGMLGHGTKSTVNEPKRVETFKNMVCTAISCGAFHTGFIACPKNEMNYIRFPHREHPGSFCGVGSAGVKLSASEECAAGGNLYMCGLGKAGQLGIGADKIPVTGANAGCVTRPFLVPLFELEGSMVIRVSCGFHHTLAIAVPKQSTRVFSPSVYAFGFGEYGRLGQGNEDQLSVPTLVQFPSPFHPTQVSAGEQHSVAMGHDGCYAWGSNDMGQLGIGNSPPVEFAASPQKVQLPEGMVPRKLLAGGRHTAAVTHCGTVLAWGWGEEGQLGQGTEKSSSLPRPCKLGRVHDVVGVPMDVALGGTHTVVVLHNPAYCPPAAPLVTLPPEPRPQTPVPPPERVPTPPVEVLEPDPEPEPVLAVETSMEVPEVCMLTPVEHKPPMIATEDECFEAEAAAPTPVPPPAIRGLKDILQQREERRAAREAEAELVPTSEPELQPEPEPEPEPEPVEIHKEEPPLKSIPEPEPEPEPSEEPESKPKEVVEGSALFGNIAKRVEIRKARKASVSAFGTSSKKG